MFCAIPTIKTELLAFLVFALLVSNSATGLASGLAGSLAFAASAFFCAIAKVASFYCFDMLHCDNLREIFYTQILYHYMSIKSIPKGKKGNKNRQVS